MALPQAALRTRALAMPEAPHLHDAAASRIKRWRSRHGIPLRGKAPLAPLAGQMAHKPGCPRRRC